MAAATTTALAGAAGSAEAKRPERDAEFDAIENRMLEFSLFNEPITFVIVTKKLNNSFVSVTQIKEIGK